MHRRLRNVYLVLGILFLSTTGCAEKLRDQISKDLTSAPWAFDVPKAKKERKVTASFSGDTEVVAEATINDEKLAEQKSASKEFTLTFTQPADQVVAITVIARKPGKMNVKLSSD